MPRSPALVWLYGTVVASVFCGFFWVQSQVAINHDVAFNLFAAQKLLDGKTYPDGIYDINPPLVMLISIPPILLAKILPIPLPIAFLICVYALIVSCLLLVWRAVPPTLCSDLRLQGMMLVVLVVAEVALPGYDFGQREHLICIMSVPYLCMVACRLDAKQISTASTVICTSFMAIGILLKPYFALLPAIILLIDLHRERTWRRLWSAENLTFLSWCALYGASLWFFFDGYFPIAADGVDTYAYYNNDFKTAVAFVLTLVAPAVLCIAFTEMLHPGNPARTGMRLLGLFALVSTFAFLAQNKSYSYHALPIRFSLCLIFGVTLLLGVEQLLHHHGRRTAVALLLSSSAILAGLPVAQALAHALKSRTVKLVMADPFSILLRSASSSKYVLRLSTECGFNEILMYAGAVPGSRFNCLFELPFVIDNLAKLAALPPEKAKQVLRLDRSLKEAVAADLKQYKPMFVLVDVGARMQAIPKGGVNLLDYFLDDPAFADEWRAYRLYSGPLMTEGSTSGNGRFRVYQRQAH